MTAGARAPARSGWRPPGPRRRGPAALVLAALVLAGCSGSGSGSTTSSTGAVPAFGGLGATTAAWDAHHPPAAGAAAGTAYGPPVPRGSGHVPRYQRVEHVDGRVASFDMAFTAGTTLGQAVTIVLPELPPGTQQTAAWHVANRSGSCEVFEYRSALLAAHLASRYPKGHFGVAFPEHVGPAGKGYTVTRAAVGLPPVTGTSPPPGLRCPA